MKISQLIEILERSKALHGDLDVLYKDNEFYMYHEIGGVELDNSGKSPHFLIHGPNGETQS